MSNTTDQNLIAQGEEWFLAQLDLTDMDLPACRRVLESFRAQGDADQALALAELLQDALVSRNRRDDALDILAWRLSHGAEAAMARSAWPREIARVLGDTPDHRAMVKNIGVEQGAPVAECFRRLHLLRALKPGTPCMDKTWGFGLVRRVDPFYEKVEIDFDRKREHEMTFAYAAETVRILPPDHIYVAHHNDKVQVAAVLRDQPAEAIRWMIRSLGPLNMAQLQEAFCPMFLADKDWKPFWERARKTLKDDPKFVIPAKRTDPLQVLSQEVSYDEAWVRSLADLRDMAAILDAVEDLSSARPPSEWSAEEKQIVADRLSFVLKGATAKQPVIRARAVLLTHGCGVADAAEHFTGTAEKFFHADTLVSTLAGLPIRETRRLIQFLLQHDRERAQSLLRDNLTRFDSTSLSEAMDLLMADGAEEIARGVVQAIFAQKQPDIQIMAWVARHPDRIATWGLGSPHQYAQLVLTAMEQDAAGDTLKTQNQLREKYRQKDFIRFLFDAMDDAQQWAYMQRIKESPAWPAMDRRSVLGHIIKQYPKLERVMTDAAADAGSDRKKGVYTSQRSFTARQRQLVHITTVEIPKNSKEIGVARSYGDLRENHEFKAAKEMQGILMRRKAELEQMLNAVNPTDFEGYPSDKAGPGTTVMLDYGDNGKERYVILGVWDRDESLGIISCDSKMAKALEGRAAGERLTVPTEHGETECLLAEVTGLSDEIRTWINADPGPAG